MAWNEDDPKDWELNEETPPDKLQKKWEHDDYEERPAVVCPSCKKRVPADSFRCLYCSTRVFHDSGLLGRILKWIKGK
jgi:hypothetical protein